GEDDHPELQLLFSAVDATIKEQKAKKAAENTTPPKPVVEERKLNSWFSSRSIDKPTSVKTNIIIAVTGFIVALVSIYYYLQLQDNISAQVDQRIFYLILIVFGIAASAVIFGLMNSYASLKGETLNKRIQLAGPVVGVVLTVFGGFYIPQPAEKTIAIRVFDKNKDPVTQGDVKIYLPEYIRSQSIDKMGQALFTGIPIKNAKSNIKIEVSSPGYFTKHYDTVLNKNGTLELMLPLSDVVIISGQVKRANETPISNVEVNVDGTRYVAYSVSNGTYQLRLEEYTLGDEITITTTHGGYEDKTRSLKINGPEIKDIDFVLQPVDQ